MTKDRFGPWVRLSINRCGLVLDWRENPARVQVDHSGLCEVWDHNELEIMTLEEFEKFINNPIHGDTWKSYIVGM